MTLIIALSIFQEVFAQDPGDLDENYGVNGISIVSLADNTIVLRSMGMQSNNKLIIGGYLSNEVSGENDFLAFVSQVLEM